MKSSPKSQLLNMFVLLCFLAIACSSNVQSTQLAVAPVVTETRMLTSASESSSALPTPTFIPMTVSPSVVPTPHPELPRDPLTGWKIYKNDSFGISLQFPSTWYGPDIRTWEHGIRINVGSDKVYPYGTDRLERVYDIKNSYYVVIQYSKNSYNMTLEQYRENQPWIETYLSLLNVKDGDSISGRRALVIRVRKLQLGRFEGLEYIETLSATAQTEITYTRRVVLLDEHLNTLHITGTPNNVEIINKDNWREAYRMVDEANLDTFHKVLESVAVE